MMGFATRIKHLACRTVLGRHFVDRGRADRKAIAITFDDGPMPLYTPRVLDLLEAHGARGTFFLIGENIEAHRDIVRRMVEGGHEIGNHSMRHRAFGSMPAGRQLAEIGEADGLLAQFDGRPQHWFRPPQGRVTPRLLYELGRRRHPVAMWSLDSLDYRGQGVETILRRFESRPVAAGDVVLFHDDNEHTIEALAQLLRAWRNRGFAFLTLSELVTASGARLPGDGVGPRKRAMGGRRDVAARIVETLGITRAAQALIRPPKGTVTILAYHRVLDVPDENAYPFDIDLVSASEGAFRRQMDYVAEHFHPINFATLLAHLDRGEPPPRRALIVTFDDGFADNYHVAFPVLRERGIPATIFVSTGYLDRQENFWFERIAHAVLASRSGRGNLPDGSEVVLGPDVASRRAVVKRILSTLKRVSDDERRRLVSGIVAQFDPAGKCDGDPRSGPLSWAQVCEMSDAGIEFGSHSVDHPILSRVDDVGLRRELVDSRSRIESVTGRPVQVVAYPVGGAGAFDVRVKNAARMAGYRLGISYLGGVERADRWDPFAIRRLHIERYTGEPLFRAMLAMPGVFAK